MLAARIDPDSIEQPRAYLSTIARRLIFDRHRRRKLETTYLDRLALLPEAVAPSPEEQLQLIEALVAIDRAIDGLPMIVKATFLYSQLDGLSYVAIAQKLGLSERTVSRYMKQALRQLEVGGVLADDMGLGQTLQLKARLRLDEMTGEVVLLLEGNSKKTCWASTPPT